MRFLQLVFCAATLCASASAAGVSCLWSVAVPLLVYESEFSQTGAVSLYCQNQDTAPANLLLTIDQAFSLPVTSVDNVLLWLVEGPLYADVDSGVAPLQTDPYTLRWQNVALGIAAGGSSYVRIGASVIPDPGYIEVDTRGFAPEPGLPVGIVTANMTLTGADLAAGASPEQIVAYVRAIPEPATSAFVVAGLAALARRRPR